jgi:non-specific serine/threonine protein kinase
MQPLTLRLITTFLNDRRLGSTTLQRGRAYYKEGRVTEVDLTDGTAAVCQVEGDSGDYVVEFSAGIQSNDLTVSCDCPYAEEGNYCKHMVAAALELQNVLGEEEVTQVFNRQVPAAPRPPAPPPSSYTQNWQNKLNQVLLSATYRSSPAKSRRYVGLVILEPVDFYGYGYGSGAAEGGVYSLMPYVIQAESWPALQAGEAAASRQDINALLETDRKWIKLGQPLTQPANPAACLNLGPESVAFLNMLVGMRNFSYYFMAQGNLPMLLAMLAKLELPVFKGLARVNKVERRLSVSSDPVNLMLDLRLEEEVICLAPGIERDGQFVPIHGKAAVISRNPAWILLDDIVAPLREGQMVELLSALPIKVPADQADVFRERYLGGLAQSLPIRSGVVEWREVQQDPVPRLYLRDDKTAGLCADLRFGYGEHEVLAAKNPQPLMVVSVPGTWQLVRLHRNIERENELQQSLSGTTYGLKRADTHQPFGTHTLRARVHPFDFLLRCVPLLTQAGFEIYGEETLKAGRINRSTPRLRVSIASGIDWFDLKTVVEFGDQQISLHEVRRALQRGERFIKLADGSAGRIPDEWLEQYRHLWRLATETPEGFRVNDVHLPLLETLLEADPSIQVPPDLLERRNRFRSFERIAPQPVAHNFSGELRPYQQHGVDWLGFLHEYKFGGILADDMGLGKTVQVLAFLQLLQERSPHDDRRASLLVVPKSLIVNWQREAAKFTPDLTFLTYLGNARAKDTAAFSDYDIVLTTYGTMLRDASGLHQYRFNYVILDESQAIKNPLAKSAKAARLLQGEHRLVLTGTPVENNTLELWSQFAFLNPGLLGNMDFFRQEFAVPIESRGDEAAARALRGLVYPFILRRTKAQVAPELPPRTERIIYADMDSAQKKLYALTRDRYRAELLGLIESKGMNDARFKILEGLLRLRQVAIHPALVDSSYRGTAPKLEILLETLDTLQAENHKALIFSQFVGMLKLVRRELEARGLKYVYLDGDTADRQARVDMFQTDPAYPFFLISLKAGGVGLNLTAAEYVIHLDPWWNPAVEIQASDRAHRIGQDKPVFIYKLIARDTVEEKILQLQEKKRALVNSLVTTEASFFKSLTKDDVRLLFD